MRPDTLVVVPMKDPRRAKSRLGGILDGRERARLARQLFERTLRLLADLRAADAIPTFDIAVVTGTAEIAERAAAHGARALAEGPEAGLSGAITVAAAAAKAAGYRRLCVLPADLATPDPGDIRKLLSLDLGSHGLALCPSRDFGTNALLAAPPDAIAFAYGPRSFHAHGAAGRAAGIIPIVLPLESLRWDIDSSADLANLQGAAPDIFDREGDR